MITPGQSTVALERALSAARYLQGFAAAHGYRPHEIESIERSAEKIAAVIARRKAQQA